MLPAKCECPSAGGNVREPIFQADNCIVGTLEGSIFLRSWRIESGPELAMNER